MNDNKCSSCGRGELPIEQTLCDSCREYGFMDPTPKSITQCEKCNFCHNGTCTFLEDGSGVRIDSVAETYNLHYPPTVPETNISSFLDNRISWVRNELEKPLTPYASNNMQWLLNHLMTIKEGKSIEDFECKYINETYAIPNPHKKSDSEELPPCGEGDDQFFKRFDEDPDDCDCYPNHSEECEYYDKDKPDPSKECICQHRVDENCPAISPVEKSNDDELHVKPNCECSGGSCESYTVWGEMPLRSTTVADECYTVCNDCHERNCVCHDESALSHTAVASALCRDCFERDCICKSCDEPVKCAAPFQHRQFEKFEDDPKEHNMVIASLIETYSKGLAGSGLPPLNILYINHILAGLRR